MRSEDQPAGFRAAQAALIRSVAHPELDLPPWPVLTAEAAGSASGWVDWLRQLWKIDAVTDALAHASPALASQVDTLVAAECPAVRETRRAALSVARYLLRMRRPTPFGLFAGVGVATFGDHVRVEWGDRHRAIARAGAGWLAEAIAQLESCPALLPRLSVVVNSTMTVRGARLIVPYQPPDNASTSAVEVSLRHSAPVRAAIAAAHAPVRIADLAQQLRADFPAASPDSIMAMLTEMVARRALITGLHAPGTEPDALGHLLSELDAADASTVADVADLLTGLREVQEELNRHNQATIDDGRAVRTEVSAKARSLIPTHRSPLALDMHVDATIVLPELVAREVETAALTLTRLSASPYGAPVWRDYHQRFYERFGIGSMVPLLDVVDANAGIGFPDGYPGTPAPERRAALSPRDEVLLTLAQTAVLDGRDEVVLDERLLAALELGPEAPRLPPHLELCVRVHATDAQALQRGRFAVEVVSVSRAAGALTGRFLSILGPADRATLSSGLAGLPTGDPDTICAQLSFPPLDPATGHVARAAQVLPTLISLAEHRHPDESVLTPADLAVACDGRRMYLAAPARGVRVEATGMHALNLRKHTPPLARFLIELSRAQCAQVTAFDWGPAGRLPFLPRVRSGRAVLTPATWRLDANELPDRSTPWPTWDETLTEWTTTRGLPSSVHLAQGDRRLPLDLTVAAHRALLRAHLNTAPQAVLVEAPPLGAAGWCDGRPHEIVVPLTATAPPPWPRLPRPSTARRIGRDQGDTPAASRVLMAKLYGDIGQQDALLAEHVPVLLGRWERPPSWWFLRFRDDAHGRGQHLRLRIALSDEAEFGGVAARVSGWADDLRRRGLLRELQYATSYPETGRWGAGPAMAAAVAVFGADSQLQVAQLRLPARPDRRSLVAAHCAAIAIAFTGSDTEGMSWLVDHVPAAAPERIPRALFEEAVRITDPSNGWAGLRAAPGGAAIVDAWGARAGALAAYRSCFPGPGAVGIDTDDVLGSLMHAHFIRAIGIDFDTEATCHYLARTAALSWSTRNSGGRR